jgi:Flp pilus assembly protein TadG
MKLTTYRSARQRKRAGTTAVEVAVTLPVFFTFVFGIVEFSRVQLISNLLQTACRAGARYGATEGVTTPEALLRVDQVLSAAMDTGDLSLSAKDAGVFDTPGPYPSNPSEYSMLPDVTLDTAEPRQLFLIRASVDYNDIAIVPLTILNGLTLTGQAIMRHE